MTACAKDNFTFAKAKLRELEDQLGNRIPVYLAHAHAYCSNADEAFKLLRKGRDGGDSALSQVLSEPLMNSLHSDGRWNEFLASIGRSPEDLATIELSFSLPTF